MQSFSRFTHIGLVIAFGIALGAATAGAQDAGKAGKGKALPGAPCCSITDIDMATKTVTGKVTATGATFTIKVAGAALLKGLAVDDTLDFTPDTTTSTSNASTAAGGTTTQGNNSPRTADTRPKDCIATTSSGAKIPVACPSNVPIKTSK
jgi:hypothetical protein